MKKFIFIMPLMAVSLLASCGGSEPFDPSKIDLYKKEIVYDTTGKNVLVVDEYEYNDKGLCIKDTQTHPNNPSAKDVYEYTYDKHENEIGSHLISYDGEEKTDVGWTVTEYTYDKQNRVTKYVTKMSFDNVKWNVFDSYEYEYQENIKIKRSYDEDGILDSTTTYTYDEKGNLVNEKIMYNPTSEYNNEKVYTVDENGCATKIEYFYLSSSGERGNLTEVNEITYLNNLWYRPLKEVDTFYDSGHISNYTTNESEYDEKNRIKLYKSYNGTEEGSSPYYYFYFAYEY